MAIHAMAFDVQLRKKNLMVGICVIFLVSFTLSLLETAKRKKAKVEEQARCWELNLLRQKGIVSRMVYFQKTDSEKEKFLMINNWKLQAVDRTILMHLLLTQECLWEPDAAAVAQYRAQLGQCCNASFWLVVTKENTPLGSSITLDGAKNQKLRVGTELLDLLPERSPFLDTSYRDCAVVGNGGILLNSSCGQEIDRADLVIRRKMKTFMAFLCAQVGGILYSIWMSPVLFERMGCFLQSLGEVQIRFNLPPMNFSEDVGTKTNLLTINPSIIQTKFQYLLARRKPFADALCPYRDALFLLPTFSFVGHSTLGYRALYTMEDFGLVQQALFLNPQYLRNLSNFWRRTGLQARRLSSGFMLVSMALEFCERTTLYGFWPFSHDLDNRPIPHHYYDNMQPRPGIHAMPKEFSHYLSMYSQGVLRLRLGKCQ